MIKDISNININIKKSNRKSYSLKIVSKDTIELKVPIYFKEKDFHEILKKHEKWILKHINEIEKNKPKIIKDFEEFNKVQFLGEVLDIKYVDVNSDLIYKFDFDSKIATFSNSYRPISIINYAFKVELDRILFEMYDEIKNLQVFKFKNLKLSSAKTRWGSCSSKGNVNISWRLAMAPLNIIYSVFVHELTHLVVLNHSKEFYDIVESHDPDYKKSDEWLKLNSFILELYR